MDFVDWIINIGRFNRCLDEFLEMNYFNNLMKAWILADKLNDYHNNEHPQQALRNKTLSEFARLFWPSGSVSL